MDGLSLEAQQSAMEAYCALHGIKLVRICKDVMSGGKDQRPGLQEALDVLERSADVPVVLKCDRLSRSIVHFCELYERDCKSGEKELVAIREAIRLDSALGRALINILLVFAQMEREATGERTRKVIRHIRERGYHFGKVPYGKKVIPAPDNPRMKILVEDDEEQAVNAKHKTWVLEGGGITVMANRLNAAGTPPLPGQRWTQSLIYNLRPSHISPLTLAGGLGQPGLCGDLRAMPDSRDPNRLADGSIEKAVRPDQDLFVGATGKLGDVVAEVRVALQAIHDALDLLGEAQRSGGVAVVQVIDGRSQCGLGGDGKTQLHRARAERRSRSRCFTSDQSLPLPAAMSWSP